MDRKIARFGAQHLPPTRLLDVLMQSAASTGLASTYCKFHEAGRDHIRRPSMFLEL